MPFVRSADAAGAKWMMRGVTLSETRYQALNSSISDVCGPGEPQGRVWSPWAETASKALSHAGQVDLGDGEG